MIRVFFVLSALFIFSCSNNKVVYWCGDHACVNKKEKEAYFEKNMTIEVKEVGSKKKNKYFKNEEIIKQVKKDQKKLAIDEKKLEKKNKLEQKRKLKEEKELAKEIKQEEKKRLKEEKKRIKKEKKMAKKMKKQTKKEINKKKEEITSLNNNKNQKSSFSNIFSEIKEKIVKRNLTKPYPDINDIPK